MPLASFPKLIAAVYTETLARAREVPTTLLGPDTTVFRAFDQQYFTVDTHRHILRRDQANNALIVRDEHADQNRWTGLSGVAGVPSCGGLYCALQQQALVNEVAHYVDAGRAKAAAAMGRTAPKPLPRPVTLNQKCVIKIRVLGTFLAADLSPHNPGASSFLEGIGGAPAVAHEFAAAGRGWHSMRDAVSDPNDYSAARAIGLALARHGYEAVIVQTARTSERSPLEMGDNVVFFGRQGQQIANLSVVEAYLFPLYPIQSAPKVYAVEY